MPYAPAPALTGSDVTDSAGGTVSRTIAAAGTLYSQSTENNERSSMADMVQSIRVAFQALLGRRGGGYRPVPTITELGETGTLTVTGATIPAAGIVYSQTNENEYRANLRDVVNSLISDIQAVGFVSAPIGATSVTPITDSSGGTAGANVSAPGTTHSQLGDNNSRATFAAKLNEIVTALGV